MTTARCIALACCNLIYPLPSLFYYLRRLWSLSLSLAPRTIFEHHMLIKCDRYTGNTRRASSFQRPCLNMLQEKVSYRSTRLSMSQTPHLSPAPAPCRFCTSTVRYCISIVTIISLHLAISFLKIVVKHLPFMLYCRIPVWFIWSQIIVCMKVQATLQACESSSNCQIERC